MLHSPETGAETRTRLDPFLRWMAAFAPSVKMPVHSSATSTSCQGRAAGSRSDVTRIGPRPASMLSPVVVTVPGKRPWTES